MSWGGLNPALTAFRNGVVARFPKRGTQSDGGYADKAHGSTSEHQPDADGTVDAFDMDVNMLGSSMETGTPTERRLIEALKKDFQADPRSQLWIHLEQIANRDVSNWLRRTYSGDNPHDKHAHMQSRQALEHDGSPWKFTHTDALLRELNGEEVVTPADREAIANEVLEQIRPLMNTLLLAVRQTAAGALAGRERDEAADVADAQRDAALRALIGQVDEAVMERIRGASPAETAERLRAALGDQAAEVGRLLAGAQGS